MIISDSGVNQIKRFQNGIWQNAIGKINEIYKTEERRKNATLIFLSLALLFAIALAIFMIRLIKSQIERIQSLLNKKDEFMSIASHELKTPITSVKASLQIVERLTLKKPEFAETYQFVEKAVKQTNKLTAIVNDLLDVSKIQAGKLELSKSDFTVKELLDETMDQLQFELDTVNIEVNGDRSLTLHADKHRLEQVLINLLSNAAKYSPGKNSILINIEKAEGYVKFSIRDFGIGIQQEKLPFVFDRYFRVEQSSQNYSGLGLGLFISSEIIKRHHGEIGVKSMVGEGSTFWFTVPSE